MINQFDTFSRMEFLSAFRNLKALIVGRHHPLTVSNAEKCADAMSGKRRQVAATNLPQFAARTEEILPPFAAICRVRFAGAGSKLSDGRHSPYNASRLT
jgi:hypothetical protein